MSARDTERTRRIEQFVGDWLVEANVPGASVAIVENDEVVYTSGFGSRDLEHNAAATPETLYGIASCSKSVAALAVLILEERGRLSVEDPVSEHVEPFELAGQDGPIRVHDLLTHTSGLPSLKTSEVLLGRLTGLGEETVPLGSREDFYRHLNGAQEEIDHDRGEWAMYNNSGYIVVGDIIRSVTGESFAAFVEREILDPLGMERSTFDPTSADEGMMTPYYLRDGEPEETPFPDRPRSNPAGGLIAPVTELTRYLRLQTAGGSFDGVDIVSTGTLARAHDQHTTRAGRPYGYGWGHRQVGDRTLIGHGGSLAVSSAYIGFTRDGEYAIAIGANTTPSPTPPTVAAGLLAILDGHEPADVVSYNAREERFDELTGEYESYRGITTATVERDAGALRLEVDGDLQAQSALLVPTDPERPDYEFEMPGAGGTRQRAFFTVEGDDVSLYYGRTRLHRTD